MKISICSLDCDDCFNKIDCFFMSVVSLTKIQTIQIVHPSNIEKQWNWQTVKGNEHQHGYDGPFDKISKIFDPL